MGWFKNIGIAPKTAASGDLSKQSVRLRDEVEKFLSTIRAA